MDKNNRTFELGLYEKAMPNTLTLKEKLLCAKQIGFDYVEISVDETDEKLARLDWDSKTRIQLLQDMQEVGMSFKSMCLSGHRKYSLGSKDPETVKRGFDIMEKAIVLSKDLGIRYIQLAGYDVFYEEGDADTHNRYVENMKIVTNMLAKSGVFAAFESMDTPYMDTIAKMMNIVRPINSPYLGVYPDIGNLQNSALAYGIDIAEDLNLASGKIFAAHLKETKPGKSREVPYGTGHTDYLAFLKILKEHGVRSFVGEFWYTGSENWEKDIEDAYAFLTDKIQQVY